MVFRDQQETFGAWANLLDGGHRRLHTERHEIGVEVVETTWKQVHVNRCQLETGVAQINRAIEWWRVLLPLAPKPAFDFRCGVQEAAFQFEQRAGQGGCQMWDHGFSLWAGIDDPAQK